MLTQDESAVIVTAFFFNSSGVDIEVKASSAELPGAKVLQVAHSNKSGPVFTPQVERDYPIVVAGHESRWFAISFIPETCDTITDDWGTVTLELSIANAWFPTIGRTYTLPEPVVAARSGHPTTQLLDPPETADGPLAAACALLGR